LPALLLQAFYSIRSERPLVERIDTGPGSRVGVGEEAVDGRLEIDNRADTPRLRRRLVSLAKKPSTALSQDAEVGV
jgi:hypothetical protein